MLLSKTKSNIPTPGIGKFTSVTTKEVHVNNAVSYFSNCSANLYNSLFAGEGISSAAFSSDGKYQVVTTNSSDGNPIYNSSDYGKTFIGYANVGEELAFNKGQFVVMSHSGQYILLTSGSYTTMYLSTDYGNTYNYPFASTGIDPSEAYMSQSCMSFSGQYMGYIQKNTAQPLCISNNYGTSFTSVALPNANVAYSGGSIAVSGDGKYWLAFLNTTDLINGTDVSVYKNNNYGNEADWVEAIHYFNTYSDVAISANGRVQIITKNTESYVSLDYGVTFYHVLGGTSGDGNKKCSFIENDVLIIGTAGPNNILFYVTDYSVDGVYGRLNNYRAGNVQISGQYQHPLLRPIMASSYDGNYSFISCSNFSDDDHPTRYLYSLSKSNVDVLYCKNDRVGIFTDDPQSSLDVRGDCIIQKSLKVCDVTIDSRGLQTYNFTMYGGSFNTFGETEITFGDNLTDGSFTIQTRDFNINSKAIFHDQVTLNGPIRSPGNIPGAYLVNNGVGSFPIFSSINDYSAYGMSDCDDIYILLRGYKIVIYLDTTQTVIGATLDNSNFNGSTQAFKLSDVGMTVHTGKSCTLYYDSSPI